MKSITPFLDDIKPSQHIEDMTKRIFNYEQTEECVIDGIKRVEAGTYLIYENNKITIITNDRDYLQLLDNADLVINLKEQNLKDFSFR